MATYQQKAYAIIGVFLMVSLLYWYFSDSWSTWAASLPFIIGIPMFMMLQPSYIAIFIGLYYFKKVRGSIASLFIILAIDILSMPHFISFDNRLPNMEVVGAYPDVHIFVAAPWLQSFGLYVMVPTILLIIAYELLFPKAFVSIINSNVLGNKLKTR